MDKVLFEDKPYRQFGVAKSITAPPPRSSVAEHHSWRRSSRWRRPSFISFFV